MVYREQQPLVEPDGQPDTYVPMTELRVPQAAVDAYRVAQAALAECSRRHQEVQTRAEGREREHRDFLKNVSSKHEPKYFDMIGSSYVQKIKAETELRELHVEMASLQEKYLFSKKKLDAEVAKAIRALEVEPC